MSGRKSSYDAEIGRHGLSCCTESGASVAETGSLEATEASRGMISTRVIGTTTGVTRGRIYPLVMEGLVDLHMLPKDTSKCHEDYFPY